VSRSRKPGSSAAEVGVARQLAYLQAVSGLREPLRAAGSAMLDVSVADINRLIMAWFLTVPPLR
jgi:hypothetical protein